MTNNLGWQCPSCHTCYAPSVTLCQTCLVKYCNHDYSGRYFAEGGCNFARETRTCIKCGHENCTEYRWEVKLKQ